MKKYLILIAFLWAPFALKAQTTDTSSKKEPEVFLPVDKQAEYPGGMEQLFMYLMKSASGSKVAKKEKFSGRVRVTFVVEKDGSLSDIKVIDSVSPVMEAEVVRIIKEMPKWQPGMQKDIPVRSQFTLPIKFDS